jgi:hypothetical protein
MLLSKKEVGIMSIYYVADGELYHYGVLGMKWGVRRGNTSGAYAKASKKLKKIEKKVDKLDAKATKKYKRAERAQYGFSIVSARKTKQKAGVARYKLEKQMAKAVKWVDRMDTAFKGTDQKLTAQQRELGKKYAERLMKREEYASFM